MWDGIFTWMKSAIDFVGVESTVTSDNPSPPKVISDFLPFLRMLE